MIIFTVSKNVTYTFQNVIQTMNIRVVMESVLMQSGGVTEKMIVMMEVMNSIAIIWNS